MNNEDKKHRSHLPMPNTEKPKFIAYDAKDPDSKFPHAFARGISNRIASMKKADPNAIKTRA